MLHCLLCCCKRAPCRECGVRSTCKEPCYVAKCHYLHLPQGGWNVRKTRLAIYKDDSTPGQESKRNVQATMCGSSPRELVIHCLGSGAGIEPFLSITVTGLGRINLNGKPCIGMLLATAFSASALQCALIMYIGLRGAKDAR